MTGVIIPYNTRVLVADARKALLLRNAGTAFELILEVEEVMEAPANARSHEQGTDEPGKTATGSHRSSLEESDFHKQGEEEFSNSVAEKISKICLHDNIRKLVIVAPPKALALLRQAMPEAVKRRVIAEICKDLVNLPLEDMEHHLSH